MLVVCCIRTDLSSYHPNVVYIPYKTFCREFNVSSDKVLIGFEIEDDCSSLIVFNVCYVSPSDVLFQTIKEVM